MLDIYVQQSVSRFGLDPRIAEILQRSYATGAFQKIAADLNGLSAAVPGSRGIVLFARKIPGLGSTGKNEMKIVGGHGEGRSQERGALHDECGRAQECMRWS